MRYPNFFWDSRQRTRMHARPQANAHAHMNTECPMNHISKNQNHKTFIYYVINNHMYLVREENKKIITCKSQRRT